MLQQLNNYPRLIQITIIGKSSVQVNYIHSSYCVATYYNPPTIPADKPPHGCRGASLLGHLQGPLPRSPRGLSPRCHWANRGLSTSPPCRPRTAGTPQRKAPARATGAMKINFVGPATSSAPFSWCRCIGRLPDGRSKPRWPRRSRRCWYRPSRPCSSRGPAPGRQGSPPAGRERCTHSG